ncbi:BspC domain-containing protein [Paraburkholderia sp.]|uniref:BspC domain-containing protein n=1 Tax=Paraburkholderia sp. TaxID=1926495 RepID=UPI002F41CA0B
MDRPNVPRRLLRLVGRLAACATSVSLMYAAPVFADQLEQHNELVTKFVNDMHADPLVADCAAHGNFVASTSTVFDHVEFPPSSFDSAHSSVTPWNDSFDEGKQRVKVDSIVTVEGLGVSQSGGGDPAQLKFRCGYVGTQMLAFSWNDPVPPAARPRSESSSGKHKSGKGKHGGGKSSTKKSSGKSTKGSKSSKAVTSKTSGKKASARKTSNA